LFSWFHPLRQDILVTSLSEPAGCRGKTRSDGYGFVRMEGFAFDPDLPQPAGTVPLMTWRSDSRTDDFATTDPAWRDPAGSTATEGYHHVRNEGFVFDPDLPQPAGTVPLVRWWSDWREDNFATTDLAWRSVHNISPSALGDRGSFPDYRRVRVEGFVPDPSLPPPALPDMPLAPGVDPGRDLWPYTVPTYPFPLPNLEDLVPDFD
jgi:hypothetical protein